MKTIRPLLAIGVLATALAGCATGPKHADIDYAVPAIKSGYGRIYFLRSSAFVGSPVQPEILLNNQVVGRSRARGFFFIDRPAGPYQAKTLTSVSSTFTFDLYPGEVKYVRTEVNIALLGLMPGSVSFSLMDESMAEPELSKLRYTGTALKPQAPPVQQPQPPLPQPQLQPPPQPQLQPQIEVMPAPSENPMPMPQR